MTPAGRLAGLLRKRVRVEGRLQRDSSTGRPVSIRHVTNIVVLEPPATKLEDLWGILPTVDALPALPACEAGELPNPTPVDPPRMTPDT